MTPRHAPPMPRRDLAKVQIVEFCFFALIIEMDGKPG